MVLFSLVRLCLGLCFVEDLPWTIPVLMMEPILEWVWFTIPVFTGTKQKSTVNQICHHHILVFFFTTFEGAKYKEFKLRDAILVFKLAAQLVKSAGLVLDDWKI